MDADGSEQRITKVTDSIDGTYEYQKDEKRHKSSKGSVPTGTELLFYTPNYTKLVFCIVGTVLEIIGKWATLSAVM